MFDEISVARAWDYNSQLEQERYARVLAKIDRLRGPDWGSAVGTCGQGIFQLVRVHLLHLRLLTDRGQHSVGIQIQPIKRNS